MTPPRPQSEVLAEMGTILRSVMSDEPEPELMMPVTEEHALRQMEIQALRQITDNLDRLNRNFDKIHEVVQGVDRRLIRIESNKLEPTVEAMGIRVTALEAEKQRREGAVGIVTAIIKSPTVAWLVGAAVSAWALMTGKVHL